MEAKEQAENEFPTAFIEILPTPDIRDKPAKDERGRDKDDIEKIGIFDRNGIIKPEYEEYLVDLLTRIREALERAT